MTDRIRFLCALCGKPVDLTIDLEGDETGETVHQECYFDRLTGAETSHSCCLNAGHTI